MYRSGLSSVIDNPVRAGEVHWYDFLTSGGAFGAGVNTVTDTGFLCDYTPFGLTESCRIPTVGEILRSDSNAGRNLSPASRAAATQMAIDTVAADDPANYSELPATPINWYVVAAVAGIALWAFGGRH